MDDDTTTSDRRPWWSVLSLKPDRRDRSDRRANPSERGDRRERQRRQQYRRTHPRRLMPFGGVAPSGRLCLGDSCVHADLVDISEGGTCVLLANAIALHQGDRLTLTLHENFGTGSLEVELEVRWLVETSMGVRVGARFLDPAFNPAATFLKTYLDADFGGDRRSDG